jgi:GNAT superfamily N-acetyltransferase
MLIRPATPEDLDGIVVLEREWLNDVPTWGYRLRTETELRDLTESNTLVAVEGNWVIGYAVFCPRANDGACIYAEGDKVLEVVDLFVTESRRGLGTGLALLAAIEQRAKEEGFTKLLVYSSVRDIDAVMGFYRRGGFTSWSVQLFKAV